ncbi:MAG TPA: glycosyltransferase family 2 protein, partial [Verrucomicrobiae bacterium]|nr:glycosyltransferase family 2 protein [Verrucomicrobiae bacterium]
EGILPVNRNLLRFYNVMNLERGLVIAGLAMLVGTGLLLTAVNQWRLADFGRLDYAYTMRLVIPGATLLALGFQTILSSFLISMLRMERR